MQLKTIWVIIHKHTHAGSAFLILKPFSQTHGPSSIAPTQLSVPTATQGSGDKAKKWPEQSLRTIRGRQGQRVPCPTQRPPVIHSNRVSKELTSTEMSRWSTLDRPRHPQHHSSPRKEPGFRPLVRPRPGEKEQVDSSTPPHRSLMCIQVQG